HRALGRAGGNHVHDALDLEVRMAAADLAQLPLLGQLEFLAAEVVALLVERVQLELELRGLLAELVVVALDRGDLVLEVLLIGGLLGDAGGVALGDVRGGLRLAAGAVGAGAVLELLALELFGVLLALDLDLALGFLRLAVLLVRKIQAEEDDQHGAGENQIHPLFHRAGEGRKGLGFLGGGGAGGLGRRIRLDDLLHHLVEVLHVGLGLGDVLLDEGLLLLVPGLLGLDLVDLGLGVLHAVGKAVDLVAQLLALAAHLADGPAQLLHLLHALGLGLVLAALLLGPALGLGDGVVHGLLAETVLLGELGLLLVVLLLRQLGDVLVVVRVVVEVDRNEDHQGEQRKEEIGVFAFFHRKGVTGWWRAW